VFNLTGVPLSSPDLTDLSMNVSADGEDDYDETGILARYHFEDDLLDDTKNKLDGTFKSGSSPTYEYSLNNKGLSWPSDPDYFSIDGSINSYMENGSYEYFDYYIGAF